MNSPITVPVTSLLTHLSAGSINTYLMCPAQFRYRYILKRTPAHRSSAVVLGSAWGTTIAHYLVESSTSKLSVADLSSVFEAEFEREIQDSPVPALFEEDETPESLCRAAEAMLGAFIQRVPKPDEVLGIQTAFSLTLEHPADEDDCLPVPLIGAFDAFVVVDGKPRIWELKSDARKYSEDQLRFMLQPTVCGLGAKVFGYDDIPVDVIVTTKTKEPEVQIEQLTRNGRDQRHLFDLAESVVRAVQAGVFPRNRGWQCSGCPYRKECDR